MASISYPDARKEEVVEDHFGRKVVEHYRWLEDPDSAETRAWVEAQQAVHASYSGRFNDTRGKVRARLEALYNYERVGCPMKRGKHTYVYRNTGLQNQDVLYRLAGAGAAATAPNAPAGGLLDGAETFMDLNAQFPDGTTSLSTSSFSECGRYFAYALARGGSDWVEIKVRDTESKADLPDAIPWVKFSGIAWLHDSSGFFYSRYPSPREVHAEGIESGKAGTETAANENACVYFHKLGTDAAADILVYANTQQPKWRAGIQVSDDGQYLLMATSKGTDPVNRLYYCPLSTWSAWLATAAPHPLAPGQAPPAPDAYSYLPLVRLFDNFEAEWEYLTNDGPRFYLKTNYKAPKYRVVAIDMPTDAAVNKPLTPLTSPAEGEAHAAAAASLDGLAWATPAVFDVVPEQKDAVLDWATVVAGDALLGCYMQDVANHLQLYALPAPAAVPALGAGAAADAALLPPPVEVPLPAPGTVGAFAGRRDQDTAFLKFVSFLHPGSILRLHFPGATAAHGATVTAAAVPMPPPAAAAAAAATPIPRPTGAASAAASAAPYANISEYFATHLPGFDASSFVAKQVFVPSKDGTRIPMFVVHHKDCGPAAGNPRPTLLYGYGGFNISLPPNFSALRLMWLGNMKGVWALANLRGGGEYGEEWHQAGCKFNKQNCFDDFAAAGQWLIDNGYCIKDGLGIMGGSNGGLLTLVSSLQHPTLYRCAISQVPVADMLRFHKFTIGHAWAGEYLNPDAGAAEVNYLLSYSPLHNVTAPASEDAQLPAILITTADHDDRVVPLHSYKMAATLQAVAGASPAQKHPLLIRIESKAGHGAGKPTSKVLDEMADIYAFLGHETGAAYAE